MATSTTTAVQLQELPQASGQQLSYLHRPNAAGAKDAASSDRSDEVLAASRLADASVPDGGQGWFVLAGCAIMTWWFVGTTYSWGVIQQALLKHNLSSTATLSYIGSLAIACVAFLAIVNARIIRRFGAQKTSILGIACLGTSQIVSSFAVGSVAGLFVTNGLFQGFGASLCFMTVSATPAQYFSRRRGLANGIVFAAGGLGGTVTSFALNAMLQNLSVAWSFRILGAVTLVTGLPAAWMVRERSPVKTPGFVEWGLFKDLTFCVIFAAGALATFTLLVPPFFLPLYSRSVGLSNSAGIGLLAGFNLSSATGRFLSGFSCDKFGAVNTWLAGLLLNAVSMLALWPESKTTAPLAVFVVLNGIGNGSFFSCMPTVVGNVFGSQRVSVAMAMIVTGWGGGYLMGSPIAGYLLDAYGGSDAGLQAYRPAIFYAGAMAVGSAVFAAIARFRLSRSLVAKV